MLFENPVATNKEIAEFFFKCRRRKIFIE